MPLCGRLNYKYMMLAARGPSITETQSWERDDTVDYSSVACSCCRKELDILTPRDTQKVVGRCPRKIRRKTYLSPLQCS